MSDASNTSAGPLEGLRVVDLADRKAELSGRILADFGADVIRVEPPGGAASRRLPPFEGDTSLYFATRNANKRGVTLDLENGDDRDRLIELVRRADVFIESEKPGRMAELGLAPDRLLEENPALIAMQVSDFGQTGPYRDWVATDATLEAIAGVQWKAGIVGKPPLLAPCPLAYDVAGVLGAFALLTSWLGRQKSGHGQAIDLSVLESMAQATDWSFSNGTYARAKMQIPMEVRMGSGPMYKIYACKTGYVRLVILSPRQWHSMRDWLGDPEFLRDPLYDSFLGRMQIADALGVIIGDHFATMGHEECSAEAQRRGIVCTPVLRPEEVLANEHFRSRDTFVDAEFAPGKSGPMFAGFFELDGARQGFRRRAPTPGEHQAEVFGGGGKGAPSVWSDRRPRPKGAPPAPSLPLSGLRVLDFGIGGVGVECGRLFAEYGADVIKIESRSYPDFMRVVMSTEMSASFASSSRSKRGFGVNLKHDRGLALIHELVKQADVVIENNSTGTMDDMGIGYEKLRELNPRIVMASSQLLGSRGAWADWIGYGPSTQPIGGMVHLWNYDDQEDPAGSTAIFPDHLAGRLECLVALAALVRRERTGTGGHGEVAQAEAVTGMLADAMLKSGIAPGSVEPMGNRSAQGSPWGAYQCAGAEQWVTITCETDGNWGSLKMAMGDPEWAQDARFETVEGRQAAHAELDAKIGEWTAKQTKWDVTAALQMFGVPVAPVLTGSEQASDPHFQARGFPRWIEQQDLGWICMEGPGFRATRTAEPFIAQAPKLGEHSRVIAQELLGLSEEEIEKLVAAGTLEIPK